jgi:hypothetical protein
MLAMTAIAAVLALIVQNVRGTRESSFAQKFNIHKSCEEALVAAGVQLSSRGGGSGGGSGGGIAHQRFNYHAAIDDVPAPLVLYHLAENLAKKIEDSGASITGRSYSGDLKTKSLQSFSYSYKLSGRRGDIFVDLTSDEPGTFKIVGALYEVPTR